MTVAALTIAETRFADYLTLVRPRIAVMVLVTVLLGGLLAAESLTPSAILVQAVFATGLVTAAASAINQRLEIATDGRMARTANRPLPAGRMTPREVMTFGAFAGVAGLAWQIAMLPPMAVAVTCFTFASYVLAYTPLKTRTTLNTLVGAVPGALPPVIGWTAVTGRFDAGALALFLIVFVWQVPHFLAIAWRYRDEYAKAGLRMLPVGDRTGERTAQHMLLYGLALVPVSLIPVQLGLAGRGYAVGAGLLAAMFLWPIAKFQRERSPRVARQVLLASLVYLPGVLALLLISKYH